MSTSLAHPVQLPAALPHQVPIVEADARNKVVCAGRRFGKTVTCLKCAMQGHGPIIDPFTGERRFPGALHGKRVWWIAPVYSQSTGVWMSLKRASNPRSNRERLAADRVVWKSEVERTIWYPGGGSVSVKTADDPDNLRGTGLDGVILDEAAFMKEETWTQVIRPALLDRSGWAFFISTPNGMNWFYELFEQATREGWGRWQEPTWANPMIDQAEIEEMRNDPRISSISFQQEIEAQFVTAGAGMFRREWFRYFDQEEIDREHYFTLRNPDNPDDTRRYYAHEIVKFATVDLAVTTKTSSHFTVISTWGVTPHADLLLLACDRFKGEGPDIVPRIRVANDQWRPSYIGVERVGFQMAVLQEATRQGLPVTELKAHTDKVARAMTASAMMEKSKIWFPRAQAWTKDLEDETVQFPEGEFDDFVDTLAYAASEIAGARFERVVAPLGLGRAAPYVVR